MSPEKKTRCRGDRRLYAGDGRLFPPVQLDDALGRHAEALQVRTHAERRHEGAGLGGGEAGDGVGVEVIVVIVADQDGVQGRQLVDGDRRRVKAARADKLGGAGPLAPDRIGEEAGAVELDEDGGVAEPGGA